MMTVHQVAESHDAPRSARRRVLIVEDDPAMSEALRDGFEYEKYEVTTASDGESALRAATSGDFDLLVLDVMLPKMSGLDVCQNLRKAGNEVPIIILTARGQEIDKVLGLKLGADDYVTKPFSFLELSARADAVQRRVSRGTEPVDVAAFGDISIDFRRHEATKGGEPMDLTPREFKILRYLVERKGQVVTREELLKAVWDYNSVAFTRTVDMHIAKLRKKLGDSPTSASYVVTVHRVGYKFVG